MDDFRLKKIIPKYQNALSSRVKLISSKLNQPIRDYEYQIQVLKNLVENCDFSTQDLKEVNKSLSFHLNLLKSKIQDQFLDNSVLNMRLLHEDEIQSFIEEMKVFLSNIEGEELSSETFEQILEKSSNSLLGIFLGSESERNGVIYFNYHKNKEQTVYSIDNVNLESLTLQYLENYVKSTYSDNITWDESNLEEYLKCIENQIFTFSEDFEVGVKNYLKSFLFQPLYSINSSLQFFKDNFEKKMYSSLIIFSQQNDKDLENSVNIQREKILKNLLDLKEQINLSNLSEGIKRILSNIKKNEKDTFDLITSKIKDLEEQRKFIDINLKHKNLKNFIDYPDTQNLILSSTSLNSMETMNQLNLLTLEPFCPLNVFLNKRNEYGKILDYQLDPSKGEYAELINKIKEISNHIKTKNKNRLLSLIVNSLEKTTQELKKTYLSALALNYDDVFKIIDHDFFFESKTIFMDIESKIKVQIIETVSKDNFNFIKILIDHSFNNFSNSLSDSVLERELGFFLENNKSLFKTGFYWKVDPSIFKTFCTQIVQEQESQFISNIHGGFSFRINEFDVSFDRLGIILKALNSLNLISKVMTLDFNKIRTLIQNNQTEAKSCKNTIEYILSEFKEEFKEKDNEDFKKELQNVTFNKVVELTSFIEKNNNSLSKTILNHINDNYNVLTNEKETFDKLLNALKQIRKELTIECNAFLKKETLDALNESKNLEEAYKKLISY